MTETVTIRANRSVYHIVEGGNVDGIFNAGDRVFRDNGDNIFDASADRVVRTDDAFLLEDLGVTVTGIYGKNIAALSDYAMAIAPDLELKNDPDLKNDNMILSRGFVDFLGLTMVANWEGAQKAGVSHADYAALYSLDFLLQCSKAAYGGSASLYTEAFYATVAVMGLCADALDMTGFEDARQRAKFFLLRAGLPDEAWQVVDVSWNDSRVQEYYARAAREQADFTRMAAENGVSPTGEDFVIHFSRAYDYAEKGHVMAEIGPELGAVDTAAAYEHRFETETEILVAQASAGTLYDPMAALASLDAIGRHCPTLGKPVKSDAEIAAAKRRVLEAIATAK